MAKSKTANKTLPRRRQRKPYSEEQVLKWYEEMLRMRRFEETASRLYMEQKIRGFLHLYIGQEAIAAGLESAITPDDTVITAYRDHGLGLGRGMTSNECMAELFGKSGGSSKGKGGSMHYFSKELNFAGGHGIVGGQMPLGAGIAFAEKYKGTNNICVCFMGDGAVRQGALHEAFNMAMNWKLPVLYIVENNGYAMGTSVERTANVHDLYEMVSGYHMPAKAMNAMDVIAVHEELIPAVEHVRSGKGPVFLEAKTYRYRGHSMSDPMKYRTREELEKYRKQDPLTSILHYMEKKEMGLEDKIQAINAAIKEEIAQSVIFAENSPLPQPSELYEDVYVGDYPFVKE